MGRQRVDVDGEWRTFEEAGMAVVLVDCTVCGASHVHGVRREEDWYDTRPAYEVCRLCVSSGAEIAMLTRGAHRPVFPAAGMARAVVACTHAVMGVVASAVLDKCTCGALCARPCRAHWRETRRVRSGPVDRTVERRVIRRLMKFWILAWPSKLAIRPRTSSGRAARRSRSGA